MDQNLKKKNVPSDKCFSHRQKIFLGCTYFAIQCFCSSNHWQSITAVLVSFCFCKQTKAAWWDSVQENKVKDTSRRNYPSWSLFQYYQFFVDKYNVNHNIVSLKLLIFFKTSIVLHIKLKWCTVLSYCHINLDSSKQPYKFSISSFYSVPKLPLLFSG